MSASPTARASHSRASLSPASSSEHSNSSLHATVSLETLVTHLLASKRSLSSISTVWRANEIVTSARTALEESATLAGRTGFVRNGIAEQVKTLQKVRGGIEQVYSDGQKEFKAIIRTLDAANARLEETIELLRSTLVEAGFRPSQEEPRNLLDFVDERGVDTMRDALKESIRESKEAQTEFDSSILSLDNDLRALQTAISASKKITSSQSQISLTTPIASHLDDLEAHAREMAGLLDSLVSHFDLCVNAIRHTEGGYAAVRKAASSQPAGAEPISVSGVMSTEEGVEVVFLPDEERREMLHVLTNDAAEVEDVVLELRDRLSDMEGKHDAILEHVTSLAAAYRETTATYELLESVGRRLLVYIVASGEFRARWDELKIQIGEQLAELEACRLFYESYHASYDGLILEVARRRHMEEKKKLVVRKALDQLDKLHELDLQERNHFRLDVGDYLPVDLYPGVNAAPSRWAFTIQPEGRVASGQAEGVLEPDGPLIGEPDVSGNVSGNVSAAASVPELDRESVERAMKRERQRERQRLERKRDVPK